MSSTSFFKRYPKLSIVIFNILLLFFIFVVFEIILRIFTPSWLAYTMNYLATGKGFGHGTDANWDIKNKDGRFYSFTPNSTFKIYHEEYENTVHINNLGGRSSFPGEKADTANIIPFTGDSFVMGVGVEDTETMVSVTKKLTNHNFVNLGVGGSCMPIQRNFIKARYDELGHPKTVLYGFFFGNDFSDIIKEYSKNTDTASLHTGSPKQNGFMWRVNNLINNNGFLKRLYTLQFIKQKILNIKNKDLEKTRDFMETIFLIMNKTDTSYINLATSLIDKEAEFLSKEPYTPVVIFIPDNSQVNNAIRKKKSAYYNIDEKNLDPLLPNQILRDVLNKYKIKYIDPTQCLGAHLSDGALYYTKDNHFTKLGQKVFSECIADSLQKILAQQINKPNK